MARTTEPTPRWRNSKFGGNIELYAGKKWFGSVGPVIRGECTYQGPNCFGTSATQDEAKAAIEAAAEVK